MSLALHVAAFDGNLEVCKSLLKKSWWRPALDINQIDYTEGSGTPLLVAALQGHTSVVNFLLANGALTQCTDLRGLTALSYAVASGHTAIVKLLLDKGADPNIAGPDGSPLLNQAALKNYAAIAELLIQSGADVNAHAAKRLEPLSRVQTCSAKKLYDDPEQNKYPPLLVCAILEHEDVAEVLLKNGARLPTSEEIEILLNSALKGPATPQANRTTSKSLAKWMESVKSKLEVSAAK